MTVSYTHLDVYKRQIDLFEKQMQELLDGKEVIIPNFDFVKGHKEFVGSPLKLGEHDIPVSYTHLGLSA